MEAILTTWDTFARTQSPAADKMDPVMLRDDAEEILRAVIEDLRTPQSTEDQRQKSLGRADPSPNAPSTAAEIHGSLRAKWGFDIKQLLSEYRALRASVLHRWVESCAPEASNLEDMTRFNEAIDQALTESVAFFSNGLTNERNLFLGALGHDMRSPLHIIQVSAALLNTPDAGDKVTAVAARIARSTAHLKSLLDDLVDFNRINLGVGLSVVPVNVDLGQLFREALEQLRAGHPDRQIEFEATGDLQGSWDPHRFQQLLGNLILNALKYGSRTPVRVQLFGKSEGVEFSVLNRGQKISDSLMSNIFQPLVRGTQENEGTEGETGLGLGLYIARQIVLAHGGDIAVRSDDKETAFTVRLPRQRPSS